MAVFNIAYNRTKLLGYALLGILVLPASNAYAVDYFAPTTLSGSGSTILDFDAYENTGSGKTKNIGRITNGVFEDGYKLFATEFKQNKTRWFQSWGNNNTNFAGSTGLFNPRKSSTTVLSNASNHFFSLNSIDLARSNNRGNNKAFNVTFNGFVGGELTPSLTQTFSVNSNPHQFQTFAFDGWNNLSQVTFGRTNKRYQFDNINVSVSGGPAQYFGSGIAGMLGLTLISLIYARKQFTHKKRAKHIICLTPSRSFNSVN